MPDQLVYLKCFKMDRLRVKIISSGYNNDCFCSFPRNIRAEGRVYAVPAKDIKIMKSKNDIYFYKVTKNIQIVDEQCPEVKVKLDKVFEVSNDCIICMCDDLENIIVVPCGHSCMCKNCAMEIQRTTNKCPICRNNINHTITKEQLQTE